LKSKKKLKKRSHRNSKIIGEKAFQKWPKMTKIAILPFLGGLGPNDRFSGLFFEKFTVAGFFGFFFLGVG
jgi:hypothetical protein